MIRAFQYCHGEASEIAPDGGIGCDGGLIWYHLNGREGKALDWLEARSDVPAIARAALKARETRPRSDIIGNGAIINLRGPGETPEDDPDSLVSLRIWAEAGRVISLGFHDPAAVDPVVGYFLAGKILDPGDLVTAFARVVTAALDPQISELGDELDQIELRVEQEQPRSTRRKVNAVRAKAIGFRRFVSPQRDALERLADMDVGWLDTPDRSHLRDAGDRFARMAEELESIRERAAIVHDELTDMRAELVDARALMLSIVALIFLPLTFITGLLGMNVKGIPYAEEPWAFWGVVGVCFALGLAVLIYFIAAHWIRSGNDG